MLHLANLCLFGILFLNLYGLGLLTGLWLRNAWLALTAGPWLFCSLFFFIESFVGLGNLDWLWPLTTAISIVLLLEVTGVTHLLARWENAWDLADWRNKLSPRLAPGPYAVLAGVFAYVMCWRYRYPNLDGSSEKIADLAFIASYFRGEKIPVSDIWLSSYTSTHYYSFQYYAAALMGRILGFDCGTAYNVAFCALIALTGTAGIGGVCLLTQRIWIRVLVSLGWLVGGSGVTVLVHYVIPNPLLSDNFRFMGERDFTAEPFGPWLAKYASHYTKLSLPAEPLSYSIYLGDYHPPIVGFYLLTLILLTLNLWNKGASPRVLAVAGACFPWCVVANTWNIVLQAVGLFIWLAYLAVTFLIARSNPRQKWEGDLANVRRFFTTGWIYLLGGAVVATILIVPYFRVFALSSLDSHTMIRMVNWNEHTPPLLWLIFLLPTVGLTALSLCAFLWGDRTLGTLGLLWLGFLLFTEFFFINDIYSGLFIRFNTTLKWWPWVTAGALLTMGPRLLERRTPWLAWIPALFFVGYPILYFYDLATYYYRTPAYNPGYLDGSGYLTVGADNANLNDRLLLNYLRSSPKKIVIEHPDTDFTNYSGMTTLANQQSYIGWLGHEQLWRGYLYELQYRYDHVSSLYAGNLPDAGSWAQSQGIDYILWFKPVDTEDLWNKVNASLQPAYFWHEFYHDHGRRVGLWERREPDAELPAVPAPAPAPAPVIIAPVPPPPPPPGIKR
ncbi:MAG: DUF2298 domain-containing protein [Methylacidiphilales bacterium]|nr:DUF2298 domain-containing protein [Candidatus Methylacidiphilales bacterium]